MFPFALALATGGKAAQRKALRANRVCRSLLGCAWDKFSSDVLKTALARCFRRRGVCPLCHCMKADNRRMIPQGIASRVALHIAMQPMTE